MAIFLSFSPLQKVRPVMLKWAAHCRFHQAAKKCPSQLRRVGYRDIDTGKHYIFLTNNFKLVARTIADIYQARWQVQLFFKWIKQNLNIKSFIGTSKNADLTQIWVAMCVLASDFHQIPVNNG